MTIPTIKQLIKSRLLFAGLLFFGVNLTASHMFYQVNSYKIFLVILGVIILAVVNDLIFPKNAEQKIPWKALTILLLPVLVTIPGYFLFGGYYNYNFRYELAAYLVLIIWVSYLYRGVKDENDLSPLLFFIGITIIYVSLWAILEKIGYHPFILDSIPVSR